MSQIEKELATLEGERKIAKMALKGHQAMMADKLNGAMGRDIMQAFERKKPKEKFWDKVKYKFDRLLYIFRYGF